MPARARVVAPRLRRVFNLQGSELIIILLLALVVLGPEKLPDAMRKLGNFYGQMKKMSTSFQQEFKAAVDRIGELGSLKSSPRFIRVIEEEFVA